MRRCRGKVSKCAKFLLYKERERITINIEIRVRESECRRIADWVAITKHRGIFAWIEGIDQ